MRFRTLCWSAVIRSGFLASGVLIIVLLFAEVVLAQSNWKEEWGKTLRGAEGEGQFTIYGCCYEYDRVLEGFKKKHPKIKVTTILGTGNQLSSRILAERRGDKYLPDVFSAGANTIHDVLYKSRVLDPFKPALILPEVLDLSKWYDGEHRYIDPEKRYIFAFVANSQSGQVSYNVQRVTPGEFKSYWDLLNSKWKGKMVSLDPTSFGMGATLQFFYFHPDLGPAFIRKLYGEMQIAVSRDARQMTDWLASGKFSICIRCTAGGEVGKGMQHACPSTISTQTIGKKGAVRALPAAPWGFPIARPIPMPQRFLSTGFCRARDRSRCKSSAALTLITRAGSTSPRTM